MRATASPTSRLLLGSIAALSLAVLSLGCDSNPELTHGDGKFDGNGGDKGDGSDGGEGSSLDPGALGGANGNGTGTGSSTGNGNPEICDGKDNDGDGIADNIDAQGDGICDCLNIGTIGKIGHWSSAGVGGSNIFKTWLDTRSPIPARELANDELTEEALAGLDVVVVLRADTAAGGDGSPAHHAFSTTEVSNLDKWVRAGGGLMTTIGYQGNETAEVVNVNKLLGAFDVSYRVPSQEDKADVTGFLTKWNAEHPIALGVSNIKTANGTQPSDATGTVVARDGSDRVAMVVNQPGEGHVIVFGDEWITYDSEWADITDQQIELLWINMIKWMSPPKKCQVPVPPRLIIR